MLRTIALILGLPPLTQFDAPRTPMVNAFSSRPDPTPYTAVKPSQDIRQINQRTSCARPSDGRHPGDVVIVRPESARDSRSWPVLFPPSAPARVSMHSSRNRPSSGP